MATIKLNIADLMEQRGISINQLSIDAGIAYNTALSLKHGRALRLDFRVLAAICKVLDVQPGEILEYTN